MVAMDGCPKLNQQYPARYNHSAITEVGVVTQVPIAITQVLSDSWTEATNRRHEQKPMATRHRTEQRSNRLTDSINRLTTHKTHEQKP